MCWSSNDTECGHLGLQASSNHFWKPSYCVQWVLGGTFFSDILCAFLNHILQFCLCSVQICCLIFLSFPFSQMLFVYNFILTISCYPRNLSPEISFLSTLPAFLYLLSDLLGSYLLAGLPANFEPDPSEIQELVCCLLLRVVLNWKHRLWSYKDCMIAGFMIHL